MRKLESSYNASKVASHLGKTDWELLKKVPQRVRHGVTMAHSIPGIYPRSLKYNIFSCKNLYTNTHSCIIHRTQEMETTYTSINGWIDKMWYVHIPDYYLTLKALTWNFRKHSKIKLQKKGTYTLKDIRIKSHGIYNLISDCTVIVIGVNGWHLNKKTCPIPTVT